MSPQKLYIPRRTLRSPTLPSPAPLNTDDSFALGCGNESLWHAQGDAGVVLSFNRWWGWMCLGMSGPRCFVIPPCFQKSSCKFRWWVDFFEDLMKFELKEWCTSREMWLLPVHQCPGIRVNRFFWALRNLDRFPPLPKLHSTGQAWQTST